MKAFLETAEAALLLSRATIKRYFRQRISVDNKADDSPVTVADRQTEQLMRDEIAKRHPEHGILGEEHGTLHSDSVWQWVLDPIDGTKSFISGMPTFGTLIGLTKTNEPQLGIIDMPMLDERWVGIAGQETTYNNQVCKVSSVTKLSDALLYCTEPGMYTAQQWPTFEKICKQVQLRRYGGDCYNYGLLASGHIDLVVEGDLKYYDITALVPVIEGAGGVITDWRGNALRQGWDGLVVAAATKELHQAALAILADYQA
ncbi:MAG: inositol-phosphate phosphatase/L-galactose 1-phosphate phosphatase/histidinol-phosphatase [Oceanospirillaceae bacterium]|jgi:inositol-phosphate phosphatase/L-galactose 1-phosphate phosphatase/histidinol-phosphatase